MKLFNTLPSLLYSLGYVYTDYNYFKGTLFYFDSEVPEDIDSLPFDPNRIYELLDQTVGSQEVNLDIDSVKGTVDLSTFRSHGPRVNFFDPKINKWILDPRRITLFDRFDYSDLDNPVPSRDIHSLDSKEYLRELQYYYLLESRPRNKSNNDFYTVDFGSHIPADEFIQYNFDQPLEVEGLAVKTVQARSIYVEYWDSSLNEGQGGWQSCLSASVDRYNDQGQSNLDFDQSVTTDKLRVRTVLGGRTYAAIEYMMFYGPEPSFNTQPRNIKWALLYPNHESGLFKRDYTSTAETLDPGYGNILFDVGTIDSDAGIKVDSTDITNRLPTILASKFKITENS